MNRTSKTFIQSVVMGAVALLSTACGGKYLVKSYPAGAKVYVKDLQTQDKKLVGMSPVQINEESRLGDVFFLVFEKQNYETKEVMVKVNEGESLTVAARLDPMAPQDEKEGGDQAANKPKDDQKPQPQGPQDQKKKDWQQEIDDLKLRVALLENTTSFYKDAMFSARFTGGPARFDRDRGDQVIGHMFETQQSIMKGKFAEALASVDKALLIDEYSSNAWLLKGSVNYLMKNYEGARVAWERCLKLDPYNKTAYTYLSEVYRRLGIQELPKRAADTRMPASGLEVEKRRNQ